MKQVLFDGKGKLLIKDVPAPPAPANGASGYHSVYSMGSDYSLHRVEPSAPRVGESGNGAC